MGSLVDGRRAMQLPKGDRITRKVCARVNAGANAEHKGKRKNDAARQKERKKKKKGKR